MWINPEVKINTPAEWDTLDAALIRFRSGPSATTALTVRRHAREYWHDEIISRASYQEYLRETAPHLGGPHPRRNRRKR